MSYSIQSKYKVVLMAAVLGALSFSHASGAEDGVIQGQWMGSGSGTVEKSFDKDVTMEADGKTVTYVHMNKGFAPIMWSGDVRGVLDMKEHKLTLRAVNGTMTKFPYGILMHSGQLTIKNTKGIHIYTEEGQQQGGISVVGQTSMGSGYFGDGKAELIIENGDDAVKIRDKGNFNHYPLVEAVGEVEGHGKIVIKGRVDIDNSFDATKLDPTNELSRAVRAVSGDISIGYGRIVTKAPDAVLVQTGDVGQGETIKRTASFTMNSFVEENAIGSFYAKPMRKNAPVFIKGNVIILKNGTGALSLTNESSRLEGLYGGNIVSGLKQNMVGNTYLTLQNGATWVNRNDTTFDSADKKYYGSEVTYFKGGDLSTERGIISQKDGRDIVIHGYEGHAGVFFDRKEDVISGGRVVIEKAKAGSSIELWTSRGRLDPDDGTALTPVLQALAKKLQYKDAKNHEAYLKARVGLVEGLTDVSRVYGLKDITYDGDGVGVYSPDNESKEDKISSQLVEGNSESAGWKDRKDGSVAHGYALAKDTVSTLATGYYEEPEEGTEEGEDAESDALKLKAHQKVLANILWGADGTVPDGYIDGKGHSLTIENRSEQEEIAGAGILVAGGKLEVKNTAGMTVSVSGEGASSAGLAVMAEEKPAELHISNAKSEAPLVVRSRVAGNNKAALLSKGNKASLTVDGLVDASMEKGTVLLADGGTLSLGGGRLTAEKSEVKAIHVTNQGTVQINGTFAQEKFAKSNDFREVKIDGHIHTESGKTGVALTGSGSYLNGIMTAGGEGKNYLYLGGESAWFNDGKGHGEGSHVHQLIGDFGTIYQKDTNPLKIDDFSGDIHIVYDHDGKGQKAEDYKAGDVHIQQAKEGASVILVTSSDGINLKNENSVQKVLRALAGKLFYEAHKENKNLKGKVMIAEGLTSSSESVTLGGMKKQETLSFKEENGQGTISAKAVALTTLTGLSEKDTYYVEKGIRGSDGVYRFDEDTKLSLKEGLPVVDTEKEVTIEAKGKTIAFETTESQKKDMTAIRHTAPGKLVIHGNVAAKALNDLGRSEGIRVSSALPDSKAVATMEGNIRVISHGNGYALGIYTGGNAELNVKGNVTIKGDNNNWGVTYAKKGISYYNAVGIYAGPIYEPVEMGSKITIQGNVDLKVQGNGIFANGSSIVKVMGGGHIQIDASQDKGTDARYAIEAASGTVTMNVNEDGTASLGKEVQIDGDIGAHKASVHAKEITKDTIIRLGITTEDSYLNGMVVDDFTKEDKEQGFTGETTLFLQNGGTWKNSSYGGFNQGNSIVHELIGGESEETAGLIYMNSEKSAKILNYSGFTKVFYEHENKGTTEDDYENYGSVQIQKAAAGSHITVITNSDNINVEDEAEAKAVLNALAGKIFYVNYGKNERNLKGTAMISEGLTSSSATLLFSDMDFQGKLGKGYIKKETPLQKGEDVEDPEDPDDTPEVDPGEKPQPQPTPEDKPVPPAPVPGEGTEVGTPKPNPAAPATIDGKLITGQRDRDGYYVGNQIKQADNSYEFAKDTTFTLAGGQLINISSGKETGDVVINAKGNHFTIDGDGQPFSMPIMNSTNRALKIYAKELHIKAHNEKSIAAYGLATQTKGSRFEIHGDVKMDMKSGGMVIAYNPTTAENTTWVTDGNVTFKGIGRDVSGVTSGKGADFTFAKNVAMELSGNGGNVRGLHMSGGSIAVKGDVDMVGSGSEEWGVRNNADGLKNIFTTVAIMADINQFNAQENKIEVDGHTYISSEGSGVISFGKTSRVDLRGDVDIRVKDNPAVANYAVASIIGETLMNGKKEGDVFTPGDKTVKLLGNMGLLTGYEQTHYKMETNSRLHVALTNKDSSWTGVFVNDFKDENVEKGSKPDGHIYLQNGAVWTNKQVGAVQVKDYEFEGSRVTYLHGGEEMTADKAGVIRPVDENDITIDNYSGHTYVLYGHQNKGADEADYEAGNIHIKKAAPQASITAVTDKENIDLNNKDEVYKTLNALAGKVYYDGLVKGENNLTGKVMIAEGLTSSSQALKLENIKFLKDEAGKGSVEKPEKSSEEEKPGTGSDDTKPGTGSEDTNPGTGSEDTNPGTGSDEHKPGTGSDDTKPGTGSEDTKPGTGSEDTKPGTGSDDTKPGHNEEKPFLIERGGHETGLMKGAKNGMIAPTLFWRAHNNDLTRRLGDVRLLKGEYGLWAKHQGGEMALKNDNLDISETYNIAQVGVDGKVGNWILGMAIDYGTSRDNLKTGDGKGKAGGLAFYGSQIKDDGTYMDIIFKASRMEESYQVKNEFGNSLQGDYKTNGLSFTMEYGKRFEKGHGFYIEPSAELTVGTLQGAEYDAVSDFAGRKKMHVTQGSFHSALAHLGLAVGQKTERGNLFGKLSLAHEFAGKVDSTFSAENEPTKTISVDVSGTYLDLELGGNYRLSDSAYFYGTFTKNFGGKVENKWRLDAGMRFAF